LSIFGWIIAGLLVGVGTRMGGGCSNHHTVFGIPKLSFRSLMALLIFVASGMAVATLRDHYNFFKGSEVF